MKADAKRELQVFVDVELAGVLVEQNNIWSFEYAPEWLQNPNGYPLSPGLPLTEASIIDGSSKRPVQWFFDNLLPEETARELLAKDVKQPVDDAFALLQVAGAESAGAITLLPPGQALESGDVHLLSPTDVSQRIQQLPHIPLNRTNRKRMSLAGAQHKMLVVYKEGALYEPSGQFPSTHILKPEHSSPDVYYQTVRNEWFVMSLARLCGLAVPDVDIQFMPEPVYIIRRFDRTGFYPEQSRLHTLDGCQLLSIPPAYKYTNSNVDTLKTLVSKTRSQAQARLSIFKWACFNAIVGNGDAHLKNLSFFMQKEFAILAPHYDLLSTAIYEDTARHMTHELSQPMGEALRLSDLTRANVLIFADGLGMPARLAESELDKLLKLTRQHAGNLLKEVSDLPNYPGKPGEIRMLNEIYYNCIGEVGKKLER